MSQKVAKRLRKALRREGVAVGATEGPGGMPRVDEQYGAQRALDKKCGRSIYQTFKQSIKQFRRTGHV